MTDNIYIDSLHSKMHKVFKETIDFLENHNLRWYVSGGTAIGAVRHHDFIPWDDDIDIYMPRKDYNRLLSLKKEIKTSTNLELLNIEDEGYTQWFAKFVDKNSTTMENLNIPCVYGVWVDIFPLDYSSNSEEVDNKNALIFKELFIKYQKTLFHVNYKAMLVQLLHLNFKSVCNNALSVIPKRRDFLRKEFQKFESSVQNEDGTHYISYCEGGRHLECDWFKDSLMVPFADYQVRVPIGYDSYLTSVFGDYMKLPPEKDRVTHQMLYVNLKARVSKKEIKEALKKGENFFV